MLQCAFVCVFTFWSCFFIWQAHTIYEPKGIECHEIFIGPKKKTTVNNSDYPFSNVFNPKGLLFICSGRVTKGVLRERSRLTGYFLMLWVCYWFREAFPISVFFLAGSSSYIPYKLQPCAYSIITVIRKTEIKKIIVKNNHEVSTNIKDHFSSLKVCDDSNCTELFGLISYYYCFLLSQLMTVILNIILVISFWHFPGNKCRVEGAGGHKFPGKENEKRSRIFIWGDCAGKYFFLILSIVLKVD